MIVKDENPDKPKPIYKHQEFPRVLYAEGGKQRRIEKPEQERAALDKGYSRNPPLPEKEDDAAGPARAFTDVPSLKSAKK